MEIKPETLGPGTWYWIHKKAFLAKSKEKEKIFLEEIREICNNFPCHKCSKHCREYLKLFPPEEFLDYKVKEFEDVTSLFVWSWRFHNLVNRRLGKKEISLEYAIKVFRNESECKDVCKRDN